MYTIIKTAVVSVLALFAIVGLVSISKAEDNIDTEREIIKFLSLNRCDYCLISGADFSNKKFTNSKINGGMFLNSDLTGAEFHNSSVSAILNSSNLSNLKIQNAELFFWGGSNLSNSKIFSSKISFSPPINWIKISDLKNSEYYLFQSVINSDE